MPRRRLLELGIAFVVLGLAALLLSVFAGPEAWWVHGVWCGVALALVLGAMWGAMVRGLSPIVTDHFTMFAGAFAVYFLFGALLPVIGPEEEIEFALTYYSITAVDALRVDAVNGLGFGIALIAGAFSHGRLMAAATARISRMTSSLGPKHAVGIFLVIGMGASLRVFVADLGLSDGGVSGSWRLLAELPLVAVFLSVAYRGSGEKAMRAIGVTVALLEAAMGLLALSKASVLLPLGTLAIALSIRYRSRVLVPAAGILVALLVFGGLGGTVNFSRGSLGGTQGRGLAETMATRLALVREGLALAGEDDVRARYHPWSRLSYVSPQAAAMHFYEAGDGGDDLELIPWLFVPRILASSKPSITQTSADFHTKITGHEGSWTGQGIFMSGYYNAGWIGVIAVAAVCGWILAQTSAIAGTVVRHRSALLLPLVLLGMYMAFRIDGHFLGDYFGPFVLVLYVLLAGTALATILREAEARTS